MVARTLMVCWLALVATASAERLPVRIFTTADGLANNHVERGTIDANGFLWLATGEGVSRFNGTRFESFGMAEGLPAARSQDILGTRDGHVYVATAGGLAVLDLAERGERPHFKKLTDEGSDCVIQDDSGVVWAGTENGLTRFEAGTVSTVPIAHGVISIAYDARDRSMWLGSYRGLVHRTRDGRLERWRVGPPDEEDDRVFRVLLARDGKLWLGHVSHRVLVIPLPLAPSTEPISELAAITHLEVEGGARRDIFQDSTGTVWVGSTNSLYRWTGRGLQVVTHTAIGVDGPPTPSVEDTAGNLWFGTDSEGVARLARDGFTSYDTSDGLETLNAYGFVQDRDGPLYVVTLGVGHSFARYDAGHFTSVHPHVQGLLGWGAGQTAAIDREHRWWYPTGYGVLRFPIVTSLEELATVEPRLYADLPGRDILRLYADSRGDVWISTMSKIGLARWDHTTDHATALHAGWPAAVACAFAEDAHGDLWLGYSEGQVVRVHDGNPYVLAVRAVGAIGSIVIDHAGRLWLASDQEGVIRIDNPDQPVARHYRSTDGLGSDQATALVEDRGRIYVGTTRGIARIDPLTDEIVHYGADEGLRNDYIVAAFRSNDHALWFGSKGGAARLVPRDIPPVMPVPVFITHLALAGKPLALAAGGQRLIDSIELASGEGTLDLELASPQFATGERLRFQYRLDDTWSTPIAEHAFHFAQLAAGHYALELRAVDARGVPSPSATIAFTVMPPLWRRWWFLGGVMLAAALLACLAYRRRLAHVLAIERVRTRIATDLHDELGSSLSRISILSEVASRRAAAREEITGQINVIGTSARELVDVASDIVWSTDPRRDDLGSLIIRLRTFSADLFDARGIAWTITAPNEPAAIRLSPDRRRHLYLVLKEAITNAARHSGATRVDVTIAVVARGITACVRDNGGGFDEATLQRRGNGLVNMRSRAALAGGTLDVCNDRGTEVTLRL